MSVFIRRGGTAAEKEPTRWAKYSIAYTGTSTKITVSSTSTMSGSSTANSTATTITYYDALSFDKSGNAAGSGSHTVSVSYNTYTNANNMNGKIALISSSFYYILNDAATRNNGTNSSEAEGTIWTSYYAYVYKNTYGAMTASTAKNFIKAGTYIEDVESENEDEYPDNGPLGLYYYVKQ